MMKKTVKTVLEYVAMFLGCFLVVVLLFLVYAWSLDDPTTQIKAKSYNSQKASLEKLDTPELFKAKSMFTEALENEGFQVDDSYIKIWSDDGLTTITVYWQSGDNFYKTDVREFDQDYPYTAAGVIEGVFTQDKILSAKYDKEIGYLYVETTPLHTYNFFYAA